MFLYVVKFCSNKLERGFKHNINSKSKSMYNSTIILRLLLLSYSCWTATSVQTTPKEEHPIISPHLPAISPLLSSTIKALEQDNFSKTPDHPPFCLSTTLSACPPNSLCIEHRCTCHLGYLRRFSHHLEDSFQCVLHHCKSDYDCHQSTFSNTVCAKSDSSDLHQKCVCQADYLLDQITQQCVYKGPVFSAKQRQFWSMVVPGAMLATALGFCCCLAHRAKVVEGDDDGKNCQKGQAKENHVPFPKPPPPLPTLPFNNSLPPGYFGDSSDFPPPYSP